MVGDSANDIDTARAAGIPVIAVDFGAAPEPNLGPVEAEVIAHVDLNSSRSDKETIHLELAFDGKAPAYNPGDSLDLYPSNDPAYVEQLLRAAGLGSDGALRDEFTKNRDVTTLSLKTVENYAADVRSRVFPGPDNVYGMKSAKSGT